MAARPKITKEEILLVLRENGVDLSACKVAVVGIRGYRKNTMGKPGVNDRNIYDDCFAYVTSDGAFQTWNGNTDPSIYRKGVATLVPGVYTAVPHWHRGKYPAFQIVLDRVTRDGMKGVDVGRHGINFHYGMIERTGSLGCQTMRKADFTDPKTGFEPRVAGALARLRVDSFEYCLIEN